MRAAPSQQQQAAALAAASLASESQASGVWRAAGFGPCCAGLCWAGSQAWWAECVCGLPLPVSGSHCATLCCAMPQEAFPLGEGGMRTTGLPGHLKKIEVVNFMCHENFAMEFGQVRSDGGDSCCSVCGAVLRHCCAMSLSYGSPALLPTSPYPAPCCCSTSPLLAAPTAAARAQCCRRCSAALASRPPTLGAPTPSKRCAWIPWTDRVPARTGGPFPCRQPLLRLHFSASPPLPIPECCCSSSALAPTRPSSG